MKNLLKSRNTGLIAVLIILLVIARFLTPGMFTATSLVSMLQNNTIYALLAIAEMMVILTGGIDISIASQLAFVGISCTTLACSHPGIPGIVWVLFAIVLGALCGALNGFLVGYLHMVPMICTLGTMYIFRGLAFVGTSRESAAVAGIKEPKVTFYSFVICGAVTGLAGMLYTANYAIGYYGMADGFEMTAIAICVLGGVSITGGKGRMDGVAIGALIMSVITYFISMIPGMSVWQKSLQGGIIIVAVAINYFTEQSAKRQALKERSALI